MGGGESDKGNCCWQTSHEKSNRNSSVWVPNLPAKQMPQQDSSATHLLGEHLLHRQEDPEPRTGAAYIGLGEACLTPGLVMHSTSFVCTSSGHSLSVPYWDSLSYLICMSLIWLVILSQYLTEPHYHARARQWLGEKLYCICTHWLFVQSYVWWPAVVSATQQRHMWLPTLPNVNLWLLLTCAHT